MLTLGIVVIELVRFCHAGYGRRLGIDNGLTSKAVLPGFTLCVRELLGRAEGQLNTLSTGETSS
ncbi:MAG: hypothetical protein SNJ82_03785 [Gemmataceae bacterium]